MTYAQSEVSTYGGRPIELYTFFRGLAVWRYTSAEEDQNVEGFVYQARPISRSSIEQTSETVKNAITINCDSSIPIVDAYRNGIPSQITTVEVRRFHQGVLEYLTVWRGRVLNVGFKERQAEIRCESIFTSILRPVLRRFYQTQCPHVLYGPQCRADRAAFKITATLAGVVGAVLTSTAFASKPDGWFNGGYIDWNEPDDLQRRFILSHVGNQISVTQPFILMPADANISVYPGCDHTLLTCNNKFNNVDNYGGQPFYPGKNPFGGSQVM